ncbi:hypothetical protein HPB52_021119 [Rhipicephalus sanguineus]|uniref:Uncharacterized protein n=1 Tax=Rhipicephalus sanguineus TaxID=34632 RepID=A0A9D4SZ78_RHISA|nr:hypothetical protein HPB52_021119 [Rhipicephalus sanguineus]
MLPISLREYINQSTKIVRLECHLRFNYECLNNNVVPRSLYCKTLVDTPYGRKLARDFSRNCLKARIQDNKQQIHQSLYCQRLVDTPTAALARDFSRNCLKARIQDTKQQIHK